MKFPSVQMGGKLFFVSKKRSRKAVSLEVFYRETVVAYSVWVI